MTKKTDDRRKFEFRCIHRKTGKVINFIFLHKTPRGAKKLCTDALDRIYGGADSFIIEITEVK